jgi:integral membrane protein
MVPRPYSIYFSGKLTRFNTDLFNKIYYPPELSLCYFWPKFENMELFYTHLGRLRLIGFLEGISFILLVGVAMPLKYIWGYQHATWDIGMAHGFLFISYIIAVIPVKFDLNWNLKTTFLVLLASLLPFGTFVAEFKIFRKYTVKSVDVKK